MGAQRCPESIGDVAQRSVTGTVTARIVDRLETVEINESQDERLLCTARPRYLAFQLHRPRTAEIGTRQAIVRRAFPFRG